MAGEPLIYHLVPEADLLLSITDDRYSPPNLITDGFVHCAATCESVLTVANDYFSDIKGRCCFGIEPVRLRAKLVFEAPAPFQVQQDI
jgi:uncharacterized protein (DUF952 family)